jgi:hypothetical protein
MREGKHRAKQLDRTASFASTKNNGIHGIQCGPDRTFSRLSHLASKRKPGYINISGVDRTTEIESFQSADALQKLLSELDCGLRDDSWIEDDSNAFGTLYYRDTFKRIQFLLTHLPFQEHLGFEPVRLTDTECRRIYSEMNTGDCSLDTPDQNPARVTILPGICASDKTHLTNFSDDQLTWPLYVTMGNIRKDIRRTLKRPARILFGLIPCPLKGAKNIDEAWHSRVGTVLSQLSHLDITGPGFKWDCADGFQRECYPLLAAWVGNHPE